SFEQHRGIQLRSQDFGFPDLTRFAVSEFNERRAFAVSARNEYAIAVDDGIRRIDAILRQPFVTPCFLAGGDIDGEITFLGAEEREPLFSTLQGKWSRITPIFVR